ncbi:MAG: response regulator [Anaerolineae bacterium]|jgi:CheY-like chemotaxis protein
MDDAPSILVVDSNLGFATMLQESLEQEGNYRATIAHGGREALGLAAVDEFDLAIVDLGIDADDDLDGAAVARKLRQEQTGLRLMLIPLEGKNLPEEMADLDVQGVLPKPFFLPDLPDLLDAALTEPIVEPPEAVESVEPEPTSAQLAVQVEPPDVAYEHSPEVLRELESFAQEVDADTVLLTRGAQVLGSVGRLEGQSLTQLAQIVAASYRISTRVAEIMGRQQRRFSQTVEGDEHTLYSLTVAEDVFLSVALPADVKLGILRHRAKAAARSLRDLISATQ